MRQLHLAIGPNGSGKTTFVTEFLAPELPNYPYVNADDIAKARWPADPEAHAYEAAQVAADTRAHLIASGTSFVAETVFSHPSKLDLIRLAQEAEYQVVLHVMLVPEELTVRRVDYRVRAGGHNVPEHKIRERYHRVWPLAAEAILMTNRAVVYENSRSTGPSIVAEFVQGSPMGPVRWPEWAPAPLLSPVEIGPGVTGRPSHLPRGSWRTTQPSPAGSLGT
ncbi:MAG: AAA family ATPase [Actinomycetota bacterium]|nr:AAA family ATPase [Actinomycetota bacterium]